MSPGRWACSLCWWRAPSSKTVFGALPEPDSRGAGSEAVVAAVDVDDEVVVPPAVAPLAVAPLAAGVVMAAWSPVALPEMTCAGPMTWAVSAPLSPVEVR